MTLKNNLEWLENWYTSQCDGDWEHMYGITIETVDNPGWYITINLIGTECEKSYFPHLKNNADEMDWYFCLVRNGNFEASCGPKQLEEILQIFRNWVEKCGEETIEK